MDVNRMRGLGVDSSEMPVEGPPEPAEGLVETRELGLRGYLQEMKR
jgi:hypothetical protein